MEITSLVKYLFNSTLPTNGSSESAEWEEVNDSSVVTVGNCSKSSEANHLIDMNPLLATCHLLLIGVGLPLNGTVGSFLISFRRLRKPRNALWLGVTLSNLFTLFTIAIELWHYYTESPDACSVFVAVTGLAYSTLLYHLLLALVCRYVAISHPLWHRRQVNVNRVRLAQIGGCFVIILFIKWPHIVNLKPFKCEMLTPHAQRIATVTFIFVSLILIAQVAVYLQAKKYFAQSYAIHSQPTTANDSTSNPNPQQNSSQSQNTLGSTGPMKVHLGCQSVSRLEQEATWSLLIGVLSVIVFTCPVLVIGLGEWICKNTLGDCHSCSVWFHRIQPYAREVLLTHTIYNNFIYMVRNGEISSLIKDRCWPPLRQVDRRPRENANRNEIPLQIVERH